MRRILFSAAIVALTGVAVFGDVDSIINQQYMITNLGSTLDVSGPGGVGSAVVGPIVVNLTQEGTANSGQTTASQGITGVLTQSNITGPGNSDGPADEQQLTTGGVPFPSGESQTTGGQTEPPQGSVGWQIGSWVSMPQLLPSVSLWISPALLVLPK